ncbi:MAG: T9SS type A sorting domain-containing protein [Parafilimonas sp.]|nr:T9SS type A sorting domain-containing protein [Parafilimonas sp.]
MKTTLLKVFIIALVCCFSYNIQAQYFSLVKDINTSTDGNPHHYINDLYIGDYGGYFFVVGEYNSGYTMYKGVAYFEADDGIHGTELWRSDNTAAGTYMVKDITPGSNPSDIQNITVCGGKLYFTASRIVYVSDGTAAGTVPVPNITYDGDQTTCLTAVGNTLYFLTKVSRLWKTDGTAGGTSLVVDFRQLYNGQRDFLGQLTNMNGTLLFTTGEDYYNGTELWKSDGTAAGTVMVKDIYPGTTGSWPIHLTPVGSKVYFTADDGSGRKLWMTDGTTGGTTPVTNNSGVLFPLQSYADYYDPYKTTPFPVINKTIYFSGYTTATGDEVYKYNVNNAAAGVVLVKDIIAGAGSPEPKNLTAVDTTLYFSVTNSGSLQLYKTDGTAKGTKLVKSLSTNTGDYISNFATCNSKLLFSFYTPVSGDEPWVSDGTAPGTKMIKDILPGAYGSTPQYFSYYNNGISFFSATDGNKGVELWSTDGTAAGTNLVKNINNTSTASSNPQLNSNTSGVLDNTLFFIASNPMNPNAFYLTDGTSAGTKLVDLNNGAQTPVGNFTVFKNKMYFSATSNGYNWLYKSNGTVSGTQPVFNNGNTATGISKIIAAKDYLFIFYHSNNDTAQLWISDGTSAGSKLIQQLPSQYVSDGVAVGDTVYFAGYDSAHGSELWRADNTAGSAVMVKDIFTGATGSSINSFAAYNGKAYFTAVDASNTRYVFSSNGTAGGTKKLFNTPATGMPFAVANNKLFFNAIDPTYGQVLFASTGTSGGTKILTDKITGQPLSGPNYLTVYNDAVYCTASNNTYGQEVFKTNGTTNGTTVLKDIVPGVYGSYPGLLTVAAGKLYFRLSAYPYYNQLWVTDGTASGTDSVSDAVLSGVALYYGGMAGGSASLYLSGYTYAYGIELYAGSKPGAHQVINNAGAKTIEPATLTATVLGNPVQDKINLAVNSAQQQTASIIVADAAGKVVIGQKQLLNAGANMLSYNANTLRAGMYTLKIIGENGSAVSLKIIK